MRPGGDPERRRSRVREREGPRRREAPKGPTRRQRRQPGRGVRGEVRHQPELVRAAADVVLDRRRDPLRVQPRPHPRHARGVEGRVLQAIDVSPRGAREVRRGRVEPNVRGREAGAAGREPVAAPADVAVRALRPPPRPGRVPAPHPASRPGGPAAPEPTAPPRHLRHHKGTPAGERAYVRGPGRRLRHPDLTPIVVSPPVHPRPLVDAAAAGLRDKPAAGRHVYVPAGGSADDKNDPRGRLGLDAASFPIHLSER